MHTLLIAALEVNNVICDCQKDREICDQIAQIEKEYKLKGNDIMLAFCIKEFDLMTNSFARQVTSQVEEVMEPFSCETDNSDYLEFFDETNYLMNRYKNGTTDCLKLPEGKIVLARYGEYADKYCIRDGIVKEIKHINGTISYKRSKKAKKVKALINYPYKKLYRKFKVFAEEHMGYTYNEEYKAYGNYQNPNAFWDWYEIGGRWPRVFLVKEDCQECIEIKHFNSMCYNESDDTPKGYKWVVCARKKDIEWDLMLSLKTEKAVKAYESLRKMFNTKSINSDIPALAIQPDGITQYGIYIYRASQTKEDYLLQHGIAKSKIKYCFSGSELLINGELYTEQSSKDINDFIKERDNYIDSLSDDTVLVAIDYHI